MRLQTITYSEFKGEPQEWTLDGLELGSRNLIVGKNASGKSRTLNLIAGLAANLAGRTVPSLSGTYDCLFAQENKEYRYSFCVESSNVISEKLIVDARVLLERGQGGIGTIWADEINDNVKFQSPTTTLAAVARRDEIQHAFLEPLYLWASTLRHYMFGTALGKEHYAILVNEPGTPDERDQNMVVGLFRESRKRFDGAFTEALLRDLRAIAYEIDSVDTGAPVSAKFPGALGEVVGLLVRESCLPGVTDQLSMSQGMFRVLSLLIHINHLQLVNSDACLLIDDIGEGLDFDRSCRLIKLLREKASKSNIQLIMSTNDKFVMNEVPLDEWSVLQRINNHVKVRNYKNSREVFESFRFTGLSNFSFMEMDFINVHNEEIC